MNILTVKNPYSNQLLGELPYTTDQELDRAVSSSYNAFQKWKESSAWDRSQLLLQAADRLAADEPGMSQLINHEAGKPIQLARVEVQRSLSVLRWAAAEAQRFAGELLRLDAGATGRTGFGIHTRFPRGVVLGITPYNFPLNLVLHKVAPALACGCSILIKPSLFTPLTALRMAELFQAALPGLVQVILPKDEATAQLTRHRQISKISFTGSAAVGWMIRQQAPEKPVTLELGGNAWVIVGEDTSSEFFPRIAKRIAGGAFGYAGQSCISVQNVAVASSVWPEFQEHLRSATLATAYGDPSLDEVMSGPLIHRQAVQRVQEILSQERHETERVVSQNLCLSKDSSQSGEMENLIAPTLIFLPRAKVGTPLPTIVREEIFAPVMTAREFGDLSEVIREINSGRYGLQTGIYTQHWPTIERLYRDLEVGGLVVNDVPTTRYDHQPYGGLKDSGQGREGIAYAMEEMTESKFLALSSHIL